MPAKGRGTHESGRGGRGAVDLRNGSSRVRLRCLAGPHAGLRDSGAAEAVEARAFPEEAGGAGQRREHILAAVVHLALPLASTRSVANGRSRRVARVGYQTKSSRAILLLPQ